MRAPCRKSTRNSQSPAMASGGRARRRPARPEPTTSSARDHRVADLRRLAGLQLERIDRDRVLGRAELSSSMTRGSPSSTALAQAPGRRAGSASRSQTILSRGTRSTPCGLDDLAATPGMLRDARGDHRAIVVPFLPLGGRVALPEPVFERGEDADDVLLRHLHRPAQRLVRRAVAPGRLDEALVAEQQAAGLRPAQELAAAVDDEVGAAHQPRASAARYARRRRRP